MKAPVQPDIASSPMLGAHSGFTRWVVSAAIYCFYALLARGATVAYEIVPPVWISPDGVTKHLGEADKPGEGDRAFVFPSLRDTEPNTRTDEIKVPLDGLFQNHNHFSHALFSVVFQNRNHRNAGHARRRECADHCRTGVAGIHSPDELG